MRTGEDLRRAAAILVPAEGREPDHIGVIAATLIVEHAHRRWQESEPPGSRHALLHRQWLVALRLLAETVPFYRRAVGAKDERLLGAVGPSLTALFDRADGLARSLSSRLPEPGQPGVRAR